MRIFHIAFSFYFCDELYPIHKEAAIALKALAHSTILSHYKVNAFISILINFKLYFLLLLSAMSGEVEKYFPSTQLYRVGS